MDIRYSKHKNDQSIYNEYIIKRLTYLANRFDEQLSFAGAIGEDTLPVLFTADRHVCSRIQERYGITYAEVLISHLIALIENNVELGDCLSDLMDTYEAQRLEFALWDEVEDQFYYLHPYAEHVHIGTAITNKAFYFVNANVDVACWVKASGELVFGIDNIPKFRPSTGIHQKT